MEELQRLFGLDAHPAPEILAVWRERLVDADIARFEALLERPHLGAEVEEQPLGAGGIRVGQPEQLP
ncbi:hypothetical protein [Streptomyces sp. NBC_01462]|uniref:hypothetical protein n=1 Tax=Streptomyces sp. NBC_01462 TaxID=2903876 RepID=UPI002E3374F0|nr:hypothetical protein [Streptomyces sp. NBC_01462]